MNAIEKLMEEHEDILRELLELETIISSKEINYPNLIHTLKKLHTLWNLHEQKEEKIFQIFEKNQLTIPVEKMLFEHKELRPHKEAIDKALQSHSDIEVKNALHTHATIIIPKLREHISNEDEILYTIAPNEFTEEELQEMEKYI